MRLGRQLSGSELVSVIHSLNPRASLRNGKGRMTRWFENGDNSTALSVDCNVPGGRYWDFRDQVGGDMLDLVQRARGCNFVEACNYVSGILGRNILDGSPVPQKPRLSLEERIRTELFRTGFRWFIEEYLGAAKELLFAESEPRPGLIHDATVVLGKLTNLSTEDLGSMMHRLRRSRPSLVDKCIEHAQHAQMMVAHAVVSNSRGGAATA